MTEVCPRRIAIRVSGYQLVGLNVFFLRFCGVSNGERHNLTTCTENISRQRLQYILADAEGNFSANRPLVTEFSDKCLIIYDCSKCIYTMMKICLK